MPSSSTASAAFLRRSIRVAPHQLGAFVAALDRLASDDAAAIALADHVVIGWRHYLASLEASPLRDESVLWCAWTRRIDGVPLVPEPTHAQVVAAGYVMRIV